MRWYTLVGIAVAMGVLVRVAPLRGQEVVDADERSPRFLMASAAPSHSPARIDLERTPVLRRRISITLLDVPLEEALKTIASRSGLDLAYSKTTTQLDRIVRLDARDITVAAALTEILLDTRVDVVFSSQGRAMLVKRGDEWKAPTGSIVGRVTDAKTQTVLAGATVVVEGTRHSATTGSDGRYRLAGVAPGTYTVRARFIGYAPAAASVTVQADQEATADLALTKSAQRLDEVVTTGTVVPTEVKALPTPISVITGDEIEQKGYQRVDQIFRGDIPGAVAQDFGGWGYYSPVRIRGASSIVVAPTVKTLVDGVDMADPEYINLIDPATIDRIEVTRGPQASTLYGEGAINGVMQIFTKKGQLGLTRPEVTARVAAGSISGFGHTAALQTDDAVSVAGGGQQASYRLSGFYRHAGEWQPSTASTNWGVSASGQAAQGPLTLSTVTSYSDESLATPFDPRFLSYQALSKPYNYVELANQRTLGLTASVQATRNWHHTLTVGYNYNLSGLDQPKPSLITPADSFVRSIRAETVQKSLFYHTDLSFRFGSVLSGSATAGVNYEAGTASFISTGRATQITGSLDGVTFLTRDNFSNTGYFGQLQLGLAERLFLTGGLRAERNPDFGPSIGTFWSPRVGAAYAMTLGSARVKLRASYGEAIRPPGSGASAHVTAFSIQLANPNLRPERQRGGDGGIELDVGGVSLGATYYNQRAIDLIDAVSVATASSTIYTYQFQNISRVKNEGWEFEARVPLGHLALSGTYSITSSTILQLPDSYPAGGYQVGDPVHEVPHTVAGATLTYAPGAGTTITASMTHLGHWVEEDDASLYGYFYGGDAYRGSDRAYWIEYPTVTKFSVGVRQLLAKRVEGFVQVDNVGNNHRFESSNAAGFVPMPRSLRLGAVLRY